MILGQVNDNLEAMLPVSLTGLDGRLHSFDALIDTGFDGELALSREAIRQLGLVARGKRRTTLADSQVILVDNFLGTVSWHGRLFEVNAIQLDEECLVGMSLLQESRVTIEAWAGGQVVVEDASPTRPPAALA